MKPQFKILYIEDDETLAFVTKDNLEENGYIVEHCLSGKKGLDQFHKHYYDLCLIDVMLPEMDGFEIAETIRKHNQEIPILFITAKSLKEDRIYGFKIGADDYITKPFSIEELILKIKVFLRRKSISISTIKEFNIGKFVFNYNNLTLSGLTFNNKLTQKEADLLQLLIANKGTTLRREDILKKLWGENDYFLGRSMDVFISRLRKHLRPDKNLLIENVHGVGFRLIDDNQSNEI